MIGVPCHDDMLIACICCKCLYFVMLCTIVYASIDFWLSAQPHALLTLVITAWFGSINLAVAFCDHSLFKSLRMVRLIVIIFIGWNFGFAWLIVNCYVVVYWLCTSSKCWEAAWAMYGLRNTNPSPFVWQYMTTFMKIVRFLNYYFNFHKVIINLFLPMFSWNTVNPQEVVI